MSLERRDFVLLGLNLRPIEAAQVKMTLANIKGEARLIFKEKFKTNPNKQLKEKPQNIPQTNHNPPKKKGCTGKLLEEPQVYLNFIRMK